MGGGGGGGVCVKRSAGTYLLSCKMIFCLLKRYCACVGGISDLRVIKIRAHITLGHVGDEQIKLKGKKLILKREALINYKSFKGWSTFSCRAAF